mgnify:CR=1 FL=1
MVNPSFYTLFQLFISMSKQVCKSIAFAPKDDDSKLLINSEVWCNQWFFYGTQKKPLN